MVLLPQSLDADPGDRRALAGFRRGGCPPMASGRAVTSPEPCLTLARPMVASCSLAAAVDGDERGFGGRPGQQS
jgi:hypothetical protein